MEENFTTLTLDEVGPWVLEVTLNRPEAANAINTRMGQELGQLFELAECRA